MSFWKIIRGLNFKQLTSLFVKFLKHPLLMLSTIHATLLTFEISQEHFPGIHGKHNKANAFRHALWNIIIAKKCSIFSKNDSVILNWTQEITDWHEEFAPNQEIEKRMDLHNNSIGRKLYLQLSKSAVHEIISFMKLQLNDAIHVKDVLEIKKDIQQLVYLED